MMLGWSLYPVIVHKILFLVKEIITRCNTQNNLSTLSIYLNLLNNHCTLYDTAFKIDTLQKNLYNNINYTPQHDLLTTLLRKRAKKLNKQAWKKISTFINNNNFIPSNNLHIPLCLRQPIKKRCGHYIEIIIKEIDGKYFALIYNTYAIKYDDSEQTSDIKSLESATSESLNA